MFRLIMMAAWRNAENEMALDVSNLGDFSTREACMIVGQNLLDEATELNVTSPREKAWCVDVDTGDMTWITAP